MKVLFIGHTYHLKTKSSIFFLDLLKELSDVDDIYMEPDKKDSYDCLEKFNGTHYDSLVIWQLMLNPHMLRKYVSWTTGVYFPMFDHFFSHGGLYNNIWDSYKDFTIINFCKAQHDEIEKAGFSSHYIQYFPKPQEISMWGDVKSLFFWQRLDILNMATVAAALKDYPLNSVHIHKVLDPGHNYIAPKDLGHDVEVFLKGTTITESKWFNKKEDLYNVLQESALYMSPRLYEGIGMSFLEAMAYGRCVIAPDIPTMNEYIKNGVTGILYNWDNNSPSKCSQPIDQTLFDIEAIQKNAYQYIADGYSSWNKNKGQLLDWIREIPQPDKAKLEKSAIRYGWRDWDVNMQPWPDVARLEKEIESKNPLSFNGRKQKIDVTVVTVVFNAIKDGREEMLLQNLESVQAQEGISIEHLIIDGGSIDGTRELVSNFRNKNYIIRMLSKPDNGIYDAMNRGIALAKGGYVVFLNSDDFYHNPKGLSDAVSKLRETKCDFSFSPITVIENTLPGNPHITPLKYLQNIFLHSVFSHQSILTKREIMLKMHGFDLSYKSAADYDFVLRMILMGYKGCYVPTDFVSYRMIGVSSTNLNLSAHETALVYKRLYNKYVGAHLTEHDAYILHTHRVAPTNDPELLNRLSKKSEKSFVGIPTKPPYSYKKEWRCIWDCIHHRKFRKLWNFLIILLNSRFDNEWYLETYKEVGASRFSPAEHYMLWGWREGRDPSAHFSTKGYLEKNPDVAEMDICPLVHWKLKGKKEKRKW